MMHAHMHMRNKPNMYATSTQFVSMYNRSSSSSSSLYNETHPQQITTNSTINHDNHDHNTTPPGPNFINWKKIIKNELKVCLHVLAN